ncbi:MAG: metal-dependent transcriptional regulator [Candidatus Pacebacteria bacterium]|nr:metal-dependent transcriptional regulator [Candidatus Paceibacterota bacterium]
MSKQSQEDYLREMYSLFEESSDGNMNSVDIACKLGVSKAAVSKMLHKMKEGGLVEMTPYSAVAFSKQGLSQAEKVMYKHRIIEVFLVKILKVDKKKIHGEAHALEHYFSDESIKRLAKFLGCPRNCPCGHNIPKIKKYD